LSRNLALRGFACGSAIWLMVILARPLVIT
jgi:hypothetical protein